VLLSPAATHSCVQNLPGIASLFVFLLFLFTPLSWVEQHDMSNMPDMSGTNPNDMHAPAVPEDPQTVARAGPAEATAIRTGPADKLVVLPVVRLSPRSILAQGTSAAKISPRNP
jgi:hypothetical protein